MKKRIFAIFLLVCMLAALFVPAYAAAPTATEAEFEVCSTNIEYFEDGSYLVTTIKETPSSRATVYSKSGSKDVTLYNSDDEVQWIYTLIGTYTIETGVSVVCTNSTFTYTIYEDKWSLTEHSNSYSENKAYGTAIFKKKVLFITTSTQNVHGYVECDAYGVIS